MIEFGFIDILLVIVYVVLLELLMRFINKRLNHENPKLSLYFLRGFRLKLFFGFLFGLYSIFLVPADTVMYYTGGLHFKQIIFSNSGNLHFLTSPAIEFGEFYEASGFRPENYGYVKSEGNLLAIKFVALFSMFSFNNYMVISLFFSTFSFLGLWFMFKAFYKIYPHLHAVIFMIFFLIPSVLFWGSGVMKDTLCIGLLGFGLYNSYLFFFEKKYQVKLLIALVISFYFLYTLKSYIAVVFIPCFIFWYALKRISSIQNILLKVFCYVAPIALLFFYIAFGDLSNLLPENPVDMIAENIMTTQQVYISATPEDGALLDYGEISPTVSGILRIIPKALTASLYRPFLWEARKVTSLLAAIEGTFLLCFTIYVFFRRGFINNFRAIFADNTIIFALTFSLIFAIAIGLNCFNIGTLVRYKIPCTPFFVLSLILILKREQVSKKNTRPL